MEGLSRGSEGPLGPHQGASQLPCAPKPPSGLQSFFLLLVLWSVVPKCSEIRYRYRISKVNILANSLTPSPCSGIKCVYVWKLYLTCPSLFNCPFFLKTIGLWTGTSKQGGSVTKFFLINPVRFRIDKIKPQTSLLQLNIPNHWSEKDAVFNEVTTHNDDLRTFILWKPGCYSLDQKV